MGMTGMNIRRRGRISARISAGERIDPRARAERVAAAARVKAGDIRIGTSRPEMRVADAVAAQTADVLSQRGKRVFDAGLADLLETVGIGRAAAHAVHIL